jgi:hypothetical protein
VKFIKHFKWGVWLGDDVIIEASPSPVIMMNIITILTAVKT